VKIGVISDTHGFLDPRIERIFSGVEHILHAGDIGYGSLILELEFIAPVTAVLGNCDDAQIGYPVTTLAELAGKKFLVQHIVNPRSPDAPLACRLAKDKPAAVVFGHTHQPCADTVNGVFYFNPGYAGKPKFGAARSVALLHLDGGNLRHEHIPL
jgi:uncharacterized protein